MPLTPREAFKTGFMLKCAEDGLSAEEAQERIVRAADLLEKVAEGGVSDLLHTLITKGDPTEFRNLIPNQLLWAAPVGLGLAAGYGMHKLHGEPVDAEDVKKKELIEEYKRWADRARDTHKTKVPVPYR